MKKINNVGFVALVLALLVGTVPTYAANPSLVNLGSSSNYVILSKSGISTVPTSVINGDIGVSPIDATAITGFGLVSDASNMFSISPQVTGKVYASNYSAPTPSVMTTAVSDMQTAYTDAAGRAADVTELGAGNIGGLTLTPGVYKWGTGLTIPTNVTLSGSANDVWIFQIAQNLDLASAKSVILSGGAKAANIFWVVAGQVNLGTNSHFEGIVLSQTAINLQTGSSINGRLLAQTAVTLQSSTVTNPGLGSTNNNTGGGTVNTPPVYVPPTPNPNPTPTPVVICSPGQQYNITTGQRCTSFTNTNVVSCPVGDIFNISTEQRCTNFSSQINPPVYSNYNFGTMFVRLGTTGSQCQAWQMFFNDKAGATLSIDGICGPLTMSVARSWQNSVGLSADGILGPLSRAKAMMQ